MGPVKVSQLLGVQEVRSSNPGGPTKDLICTNQIAASSRAELPLLLFW
jgi:hypothetical protein